MKFSCTKENLFRGLAATSRTGGRTISLPILSNVLIKVEDGGLTLVTTNLETAAICRVRGKVEEKGETTVLAKLLSDFVSLLPKETIEITSEGDRLKVNCGNEETKIATLPPSEFPLIPPLPSNSGYCLSVADLKKGVGRVCFAAASNEARPELTGVLLDFRSGDGTNGSVILAATDSYRLAETLVPCQGKVEEKTLIIPSRAVVELTRILALIKEGAEGPDLIEVVPSGNQVLFRLGSIDFVSRTIEGSYPNYRQILPTRWETEANFSVAEFSRAVRAASLFTRLGMQDVELEFGASTGQIIVRGSDAARGECVSVCPARITGRDNRVTVNFRYLLDGLAVWPKEEASLRLIDGNSPCLLTSVESDQNETDRFIYLIMPIRT